jgi:hypothetical protein
VSGGNPHRFKRRSSGEKRAVARGGEIKIKIIIKK